jgi:2-polyprenyl-3-methyl-5-hydroxy-6-metoxy-1,4-benzoquinol methylase
MSDLEDLYRAVYAHPARASYGRGLTRCSPFIDRIWRAGLGSVVALGCGHGDELIAIHGMVPRCLGVDFALPPKIWHVTAERSLVRMQAALQDLDCGSCVFDAVVSFDVLEHLPEVDLDQVLLKAAALAPRACLVVANLRDVHRLPDGSEVDLHLIQQPASWWAERVGRVTGWPVAVQALDYCDRFGLWCGEWP